MFAADVHAQVLNGVDDSLSRNRCWFKFQQSWDWTKQVLHFGSACGKGNLLLPETKLNSMSSGACLKK